MHPDAAIFARLADSTPAREPAEAARRLAEVVRELSSLLREAAGCVEELQSGRRGAGLRLPHLLACAEDAAAEQGRCAAVLSRALSRSG